MRATLVHNPGAGEGGHSVEELLEALRAAGLRATPCSSQSPDELDQVLADPGDLLVIAGGDGTVARVLKTLPRRDVPVGIVPVGTANNIARSFGVEDRVHELAAGWGEAPRRHLRVGVARGPWGSRRFVEGVGFGAMAQAAGEADAHPAPAAERLHHSRAKLRRILADASPIDLRLEPDGRDLGAPLLLAELLHIAFVGPSLGLAADADPSDGKLEVVAVTPAERSAMLEWLDGEADRSPPALRRRASHIRAEWRDVAVHVDDEFPDTEAGMCELELEPEPITLLVPARGGAR